MLASSLVSDFFFNLQIKLEQKNHHKKLFGAGALFFLKSLESLYTYEGDQIFSLQISRGRAVTIQPSALLRARYFPLRLSAETVR